MTGIFFDADFSSSGVAPIGALAGRSPPNKVGVWRQTPCLLKTKISPPQEHPKKKTPNRKEKMIQNMSKKKPKIRKLDHSQNKIFAIIFFKKVFVFELRKSSKPKEKRYPCGNIKRRSVNDGATQRNDKFNHNGDKGENLLW